MDDLLWTLLALIALLIVLLLLGVRVPHQQLRALTRLLQAVADMMRLTSARNAQQPPNSDLQGSSGE